MNAIAELKRTSNMMRWCLTIAVLLLFYFSFLFVSIWFVFKSDRNKHSTAFVHKIFFTLTKKKKYEKFAIQRIRWWYWAESFLTVHVRVAVNSDMHFYPLLHFSFIFSVIFLACLMKGEILFIDSHWTPIGNTEK